MYRAVDALMASLEPTKIIELDEKTAPGRR